MNRLHYAAAIVFAVSGAASAAVLKTADEAAAFKAAGFKRIAGKWQACEDSSAGYEPGAVESVADLNGDGMPEAILTEGGSFCYGNTGAGYFLVSKQKSGWKLISSGPGMLTVLATRGAGRWQDLEIGGPGFCFPVLRFDGKQYRLHRHQYEGKACRPR